MVDQIDADQYLDIPKPTDIAIICLPNVGGPLPNISDTNTSEVEWVVGVEENLQQIVSIPEVFANMETINVVRNIQGITSNPTRLFPRVILKIYSTMIEILISLAQQETYWRMEGWEDANSNLEKDQKRNHY